MARDGRPRTRLARPVDARGRGAGCNPPLPRARLSLEHSYKSSEGPLESTALHAGMLRASSTTRAPHAGTIGSIINVLPDRTVVDGFVVFADHKRTIRGAYVADVRSTDLGATWSKKATLIAPVDPSFPGPTDPDHPNLIIRGGELPDFAVDAVSGKLYAVWDDDLPDGLDKVFFSQSSDGGLTWSDPVKINKTPTNIPALNPAQFT